MVGWRNGLNKQDIKEKIIFVGFTFGVFLPVRIVFYSLVSTWWVGSFGLITALMLFMLYLVKKEKLGYVGRIWKKQIIKISKGKLGIGIIIGKVMSIIVFAMIIWATDINQNTAETNQLMLEMNNQGIDSIDDVFKTMPQSVEILAQATPEEWEMILSRIQTSPERWGQIYAIVDKMTFGYHQHFNMVFLVESMETLGIVLYFKFFYQKKKVQI